MSSKASGKKYVHNPNKKKVAKRVIPKHEDTPTGITDSRVNLFFKSARGLEEQELKALLAASWETSPIDTLKLIFQMRDCRGGKGERNLFVQSLDWLNGVAPTTVEKNFKLIPEFGSYKDVVQLIGTSAEPLALELLSTQLKKDLKAAQEDPKAKISLAAKWAPTEGHDGKSKAVKKLALLLATNKSTAKKDYRKNYLVPLRKHLKIVECKMAANEWKEINYNTVPSRCMMLSKTAFQRHEPELFAEYLAALEKGEAKVNAKQLFPHELVKKYFGGGKETDTIIEEQWKVLVEETRKLGSLKDCIVLSDVSGSMSGTPMEVSVALGILISSVTAQPFKDLIITFHEKPSFHMVKGASLNEKVKSIMDAPWGGSTNFNAVFEMILNKAIENKLPESDMPKKMFVISDMAFDVADRSFGKSNHEALKDRYREAGYKVPTMIYWNVNGNSMCTPVSNANEADVGLISGFSPSILKSVIECGEAGKITPMDLMYAAINDKRYADLSI
ncbi:hypothetical protein DICPUDRAFT_91051 [Dictyostelium purpureum]|uniref:TROVE domain-containing protein n=1 Tax=Dictyostelium purpureum TaxID=5786 RepID=F0Z716_DICPU|nr:uncharacterized protein DICPUDRAFT_91051 [Dictyostelium purpureum]EGC40254.1 hypothetical protein DICPUDRAFT_91051 [Dictyostelium purpureum]|eukprot:XP_003283190.1 hypothetical protein DICPUDRAFT_91051 [Dictyostelium purpureum]